MERIFEVQELFETILRFLPTRDLLLAQRVSRKWRDTITNSPWLQTALFFRAVQPSEHPQFFFNELLAEIFPLWFTQAYPSSPQFDLNHMKGLAWATDEARKETVLRQDASWRRMFVCQPALQLVVRQISSSRAGQYALERRPSDSAHSTCTMGDLYDITQEWISSYGVPSFCVEWCCYPRPYYAEDSKLLDRYDRYMADGLPVAEAAELLEEVEDRNNFIPRPSLALHLRYVMQCTMPSNGRVNPQAHTFRSQSARKVILVDSTKGERLPHDNESERYVSRKMEEHLRMIYDEAEDSN